MKTPTCVVIVNWERPGDTIECLRSVRASDAAECQVLIVDNGSRDDSKARILVSFPDVVLVALERNLGFAGGYNAGIEHALASGARSVFLLNNDTAIESDTIKALLDSSWDIAVPKILFYSRPDHIWSAGAQWRPFPPAIVMRGYGLLGRGAKDGPKWDVPRELDYATGCALMITRDVLEAVGGFDTDFENYMEDYEFCDRVRAAGGKLGYVPSARVYHKVSQTLGQSSPTWWWYMGRNTVLLYRKRNRFSPWTLWSTLAWVSARETVKGNVTHLPDFWRGVKDGLTFLKERCVSAHE